MRTPCRVNSQTLYLGVLQICWICKDQIMPWMQPVRPQWQRSWMHVASFKHGKPMSCLLEQPIGQWIQQRMRSSALLAPYRRHIRLHLMLVQMDSSWVKVLVSWCSSVLAMLSLMTIPSMQSSAGLVVQATVAVKELQHQANVVKFKPLLELTIKQVIQHLRSNWSKHMEPPQRWVMLQNCPL